jgi:Bacterial SH3 domain
VSVEGLAVGGWAIVAADDVRVRNAPGTSAAAVGSLDHGIRVRLTGGPESVDEFDWYQVEADTLVGWVAAGNEGNDWLIPTGLQASGIEAVEWIGDQASLEGAILNDVIRFGSLLVAVGNTGGASGEPRHAAAWTSADARSWERAPGATSESFPTFVGLPDVGGMVAVATDGERLVAVGGVGPGYGPEMLAAAWTSTDAITWERAMQDPTFAGSFLLDVAAFEGGWIAVGVHEADEAGGPERTQSGAIWLSTDGRSWHAADVDLGGPAGAVGAIGADLVVLAGDVDPFCGNCFGGGTHVFVSGDGSSWSPVTDDQLPSGFGAGDLALVGTRLVTVGAASKGNERPIGNVLFETRDGREWRRILTGPVVNGRAGSLVPTPAGLILVGSLVPTEGNRCCGLPAFWGLGTELTWGAVLPDRRLEEGSVDMQAAAPALDGTIVAVGGYQAQSADGSCCVIRGVVALAHAVGID